MAVCDACHDEKTQAEARAARNASRIASARLFPPDFKFSSIRCGITSVSVWDRKTCPLASSSARSAR